MEYELRVLSGLHRGACLPLGPDERLSLGSASDCDVVLVDQGLQGMELQVWLADDGWYAARCDSSGRPSPEEYLSWGQPEVFGSVVVTICESSHAWTFMSPEQVAPQPEVEPASPSSDVTALYAPNAAANRKMQKGYKTLHRLILAGTLVLGVATFSISRTVSSDQDPMARLPAKFEPLKAAMLKEDSPSRYRISPDGMPAPLPNSGGSDTEKLTHLLTQRLKDVYLADKLELELTDSEWTIRGALDDDDKRQIERVMAGFYKEHEVKIPLRLKVSSPEELLPFKIKQFNGGALASVVVDDGTRIYVGDVHKGYALQRIEGRRVTFTGKRKVEVLW